jgi:hypothetical protein
MSIGDQHMLATLFPKTVKMRVQLEQCHELRVHKEACQVSGIMSSAPNG